MFRLLALFAMIATAQAACDATATANCVVKANIAAGTCDAYKAWAACYSGDCCTDDAKKAFTGFASAMKTLGCSISFCTTSGSSSTPQSVSGSQQMKFTTFSAAEANTNANKAALSCGAANAYVAGSCTSITGTGCSVTPTFDAATNLTQNVTSCTGAVTAGFTTGSSVTTSAATSRRAGSVVTFVAKYLATTISQSAFTTAATPATFKAAFKAAMATLPGGFRAALTANDIDLATVEAATGIALSSASSVAPAMATMAVVGVAALFH